MVVAPASVVAVVLLLLQVLVVVAAVAPTAAAVGVVVVAVVVGITMRARFTCSNNCRQRTGVETCMQLSIWK